MPRTPLLQLAALASALACCIAVPAVAGAAVTGPSAVVGAVDCDAGGPVATLTNPTGAPVRFTVLRDDVAVASAVVAAGVSGTTRVVPLAEGQAARITVRYGSSYVSAFARRDCGGAAEGASQASTASAADAPFVATTVAAPTGTRGATGAPEAAAGDRGADLPTIDSTPAFWPYALAALAALLALGLLLASGPVRARRRSLQQRRAPAGPPPA